MHDLIVTGGIKHVTRARTEGGKVKPKAINPADQLFPRIKS